jgi:DNA polymerase-3 subunit delta
MAKAASAGKVGYKELKAELRKGQSRRVYVLYGEEQFLIDKLVASLIAQLVGPGAGDLDYVRMSGSSAKFSLDRLRAEVLTPPFLSPCKLVVVRSSGFFTTADKSARVDDLSRTNQSAGSDEASNDESSDAQSAKNRQQEVIRLLGEVPDSACLVLIEDKVDRRLKSLVSQIEKVGVLAEIGLEQPALLRQWIEAECRQRGLTIDPLAAESLVDRCENRMLVIWQELTKLFLYQAYAGQTRIDPALIEQLSLPDLRGNIFDMTDAISKGQTARALELLDLLLGQKEPVQLIAFMLARHIRQLLVAKDLERSDVVVRELKVMPFVANRLLQQAKALSCEQLESLYNLCYETDLAVKTGQLAERLALEMLLISAAQAVRPSARRPSGLT